MSWKQPIDTDVYRWFGDDHLARDLFIHLLLRARNKDMEHSEHYKKKPYQLKRGQVIFGRNEFAKLLRGTGSGTYKALHRLSSVYSKVTSKSNSDYTVITILNFDELVCMEQPKKQQSNKQVTSKEQAGNTNKNVKKEKIVKNDKIHIPLPAKLNTANFLKTWEEFKEHRRLIKKPMTDLAMEKMLKRLSGERTETAIAMLEQSIENGWQGVFEIKANGHSQSDKVKNILDLEL